MVSNKVRPQEDIVSTRLLWNASALVSAKNSALASIPCYRILVDLLMVKLGFTH